MSRKLPVLEAALGYAERGWFVFPAPPGEKKSHKSAEHSDGRKWGKTLDPAEIKRDWKRWPDADVGIATGPESGFFVVEVDTKEGHDVDGMASLAELERRHGPLPKTLMAESPSGSLHFYFKWPSNGTVITNSASKIAPGIDVRGEGGMVIAPPSVRNGKSYRWLNDLPVADAPEWLIDAAIATEVPEHLRNYDEEAIGVDFKPSDLPGRSDDELAALLEASRTKGKWHDSMLRAVASMIGRGWSDSAIRLASAPYCHGGAGDPDLARLISDGRKKFKKPDENNRGKNDGAERQTKADQGQGQTSQGARPTFELFWHGQKYDRALRPWLIEKLIFETGTGLASGQWGAAKTFGVLDLSASVMTATTFAGRKVVRRGGVVFVAAEGASEIPIRLAGLVEQKLRPEAERAIAAGAEPVANLDSLPFAWIEDCPDLQDINSFNKLVATVGLAGEQIRERFDLPLALIIIDTMSAAGNFKDQDDAAEGQFVMNRLAELSRQTRAFVLAVDHFGKAVESGTRGTSAKEASADVILAWLADRQLNGAISSTRMALRKLRGGQVGIETPFNLRVVDAGEGETTCVVEWQSPRTTGQGSTAAKERWPKSLRIFKAAMATALTNHGKTIHPFGEGAGIRAVPDGKVRQEFMTRYPAEGDEGAKRKAYGRALSSARERELIGSREIEGIDYLWLVFPPEPEGF
jgi:hypothetical protein